MECEEREQEGEKRIHDSGRGRGQKGKNNMPGKAFSGNLRGNTRTSAVSCLLKVNKGAIKALKELNNAPFFDQTWTTCWLFLPEDSSPKVLSETLERIKTGRTLIYHSGVETLFPSCKDRVICRVVIRRREYGADIKGGFSKDLEAAVMFATLCCSETLILHFHWSCKTGC